MTMYADLIVDISIDKLDRPFQYRVPAELEEKIRPGMLAEAPFGNGNRTLKGYVIALKQEPDLEEERIKDLLRLRTDEETVESRLISLAAWMRNHYGSTMIQALRTVLPLQEKMKAREKTYLVPAVDRAQAETFTRSLRGGRAKARLRIMEEILTEDRIETSKYSPSVYRPLVDLGILKIQSEEMLRIPVKGDEIERKEAPLLNEEQEDAARQIFEEWKQEKPRPVLIHGVTGSGKTVVYMRLIDEMIARGKETILLIPEIALTYQTVRRFYARFGEQVSVLNSRLSQGERYDQFKRAKRGEIKVMIGPRSALFTPFSNLGLIIIDEEHEQSYKSEHSPRYHARETALYRAQLENAQLVLGSATPSLEAYRKAETGDFFLIRLKNRFEDRPLPDVRIVDMRAELKAGNRSIFSRSLASAMEERLVRGEQTMLFLNRRGYAGFVSCRSCGHVMKCPHCDVSLAEHNGGRLVCHYCGYEMPAVKSCPECGSSYIGGFKVGTQQIEEMLSKQFPGAGILRMDFDTTRTKGSYEEILASFARHEADILVGTQMIVKGHDFPDVTLVGILAADMSLNASDFRSAERTFQLLTQAVGRSGRGRKTGEAFIQTYSPDHYSILTSAEQDYEAFYEQEYSYRLLLDYPPAGHMLCILAASQDEESVEKGMYYIALFLKKICPEKELHMIGPAVPQVGKVKDAYRRILYLKHENETLLSKLRERTEAYISVNPGFNRIHIQFDFS